MFLGSGVITITLSVESQSFLRLLSPDLPLQVCLLYILYFRSLQFTVSRSNPIVFTTFIKYSYASYSWVPSLFSWKNLLETNNLITAEQVCQSIMFNSQFFPYMRSSVLFFVLLFRLSIVLQVWLYSIMSFARVIRLFLCVDCCGLHSSFQFHMIFPYLKWLCT